jgi:hypothetical protein
MVVAGVGDHVMTMIEQLHAAALPSLALSGGENAGHDVSFPSESVQPRNGSAGGLST